MSKKLEISESTRIVEWNDGDITLEDTNQIFILTEDEQKALRDYLNKKFPSTVDTESTE